MTHFARYARIPWEVLTLPGLSSDAKMVYGILAAHVFEGNVAKIGQRLIARHLGVSQSKVGRKIVELIRAKVIRPAPLARGQRRSYELVSEIFGQKQGKEDVIRSSPRGKRLVSVGPA